MSREDDDSIIPEELTTNPERIYKNLEKLALIVLHRHFSYVRDPMKKEDLVAEGICKAIELIQNNQFDTNKSTIRTYLYTGMRNQMQNMMYKTRKEVVIDGMEFADIEDEDKVEDYTIEVDEDLVYDICDKYFRLGNYHNPLIKLLISHNIVGELSDLPEPEEIDQNVLDFIVCEYMWRVKWVR